MEPVDKLLTGLGTSLHNARGSRVFNSEENTRDTGGVKASGAGMEAGLQRLKQRIAQIGHGNHAKGRVERRRTDRMLERRKEGEVVDNKETWDTQHCSRGVETRRDGGYTKKREAGHARQRQWHGGKITHSRYSGDGRSKLQREKRRRKAEARIKHGRKGHRKPRWNLQNRGRENNRLGPA